ncbi:hypothetical protein K0F62_21090 [Bacteroides fragilis]|nr:hypothetical protein [Bacteroides fragilis]
MGFEKIEKSRLECSVRTNQLSSASGLISVRIDARTVCLLPPEKLTDAYLSKKRAQLSRCTGHSSFSDLY